MPSYPLPPLPERPKQGLAQSLAESIASQIANGAYKAGDRLPSLRELAQRFGYAKNTVVAAFEILVARGLLDPRRGAGYFVRDIKAAPHRQDAGGLTRAMDTVWLMRQQFAASDGHIVAGAGLPPAEWMSGARLDKLHHKIARAGLGTMSGYGDPFGYEPLRRHLVRNCGDLGIDAEPSEIVTFHGANDAADVLIRYFIPSGECVFVDEPGYYPLFGKLKLAGADIVGIPRRGDGPDVQALERSLRIKKPRLFFTQSVGQNPTGSDISPANAFRVLQLANEHNFLVVEMDPVGDFAPASAPRMCSLDQLDRTIYIGTFSKTFSAPLRVGFVACRADLAQGLADLKAITHVNSSEYCERTMDAVLTEGHYHRHLKGLRAKLAAARKTALALFDELGAEVFSRSPHSLYVWATLPGFADSIELAEILLREKIVLAPGRIFNLDSDPTSPWVRYNVAAGANPRFGKVLKAVLQRRHVQRPARRKLD
ncbi:MAG: PLP-dependent aminotransferase family protein [Pseudomonadota bacterium]